MTLIIAGLLISARLLFPVLYVPETNLISVVPGVWSGATWHHGLLYPHAQGYWTLGHFDRPSTWRNYPCGHRGDTPPRNGARSLG
jgi:hypothetical protein